MTRKTFRMTIAAAAATSCLVAIGMPAEAATDPTPRPIRISPPTEDNSFPRAFGVSTLTPTRNPIGANDWSCKPSAAHPNPVVLVHGTWENAYNNWNGLAPILKDQGYCVYALNYGNSTGVPFLNGTGDMIKSANEITPFVDKVRSQTGAAKVDLIGHSQGGALIRYYANKLATPGTVDNVIGLAPSNHPTTLSGITELAKTLNLFGAGMTVLNAIRMPAAAQQADQSPNPQAPFYQQVNGGSETVAGINYTVIATKNDEVVTPYERAFIKPGPDSSVDNITIQNVCAVDQSEHLSLPYSKNVAQIVLNKLDPADQHAIRCYPQSPIFGSTGLIG
ncbi:alpha/beta fold hydrolase [Flexivirga sp. ID2601S]|uniref:Alpha/beta fold hydrolase n=1 Tax=Flexivirga aerilata TaxID=1656889 RepID=A0A849AFL5_9MICO|nr:alpha/beta fold hydrolase [Flexivirga aerilata]NNG37988.1 alpha/beta fold hydrolase [Flexivirga aerilata]